MAGTYEQAAVGDTNASAGPKWVAQFKGMNEKLNSSNLLEDSGLASPNNGAYRTIFSGTGTLIGGNIAGTYYFITSQQPVINGGNAGSFAIPFFYLAKADYEVAGKTQKLRLRAQIGTNATKPLMTYTLGLYPITGAGGAGEYKATLGTVVSGSTVAFAEPAASTISQGNSGDLTIPADGAYAIGLVTSAETTANTRVQLNVQLQTRSV